MTQVLETDEAGRLVLPAELLGGIKPHTRYVVEPRELGWAVSLEPTTGVDLPPAHAQTPEEWMKEWRELAEEIGKVWPAGKSAADVVSEMRR
jgi:hypothetical protein